MNRFANWGWPIMILHRTPLVAFAGHQIQIWEKPRIPDSTSKTDIPDSTIPIPLHGTIKEVIVQNCKWLIAVKRNKMDQNLPNTTFRRDLICWDGFCTSLSLNVSDMWDGLPAKYLEASSKPTNYNAICIFTHKSDLFFSARKHSAFFAVTTLA